MSKVNIDAIIPREDFEAAGKANKGNLFNTITVTSFSSGLFYPFLRKPDFQRETNEWDGKKIFEFLESYINGDLIPSIILWRSNSGYYFVIDGAHRLSALASWIYDDYGDGDISNKFYDYNISEEQKRIACEVRKMINSKIGAYKDIVASTSDVSNSNQSYLNIAQNLGAYSIQVQWIDGDSNKAEHSFFKINQQGVQINNTEIKLLESRKKGNCIAARAIKSSGTGHKYWSDFSADNQNQIKLLADEINKILFSPPLVTPVKTLDLPIAGKISSSQTLPLVLDFVNLANSIPFDFKENIKDDTTGEETVRYLKKARQVAWRMNSTHESSLGLHPCIYFYSFDGRHKPVSFYAIVAWIVETEKRNKFREFIAVRKPFESLLLKYGYLVNDINRKHRQVIHSYSHVKEFYILCLEKLNAGKSIDDSIKEIIADTEFSYLKIDATNQEITNDTFSSERKSAVFMKEAITSAIDCNICHGLIHRNSITIDHKIRKADGGKGSVENGQVAHPYCNSTIKN